MLACFVASIQAKHFGTTSAFKVSVLMLRRMVAGIKILVMLNVFFTRTITKDAVISCNLMGQSGIGQAIEGAIQCDAIHVDESILQILM